MRELEWGMKAFKKFLKRKKVIILIEFIRLSNVFMYKTICAGVYTSLNMFKEMTYKIKIEQGILNFIDSK
jgi:hypothetical protein